jgi:hypothetical protein
MYLDCKGLVTIGLGCLIDPESLARPLPFRFKGSDKPADPAAIGEEWHRVKDNQLLAKQGYKMAGRVTQLYLTGEGIDQLARRRIESFEATLRKYLPEWDHWPANAQLATMSMAWAMGAGFVPKFKNWWTMAKTQNWPGCAKCCGMNATGNVGLIPRNKANVALFNAADTENPDVITLSATGL